jgi:hypothetical protein
MTIILATQVKEIRKIKVQSQPGQIVFETLSRKNPSHKRASRVAQGVGPEFKPQYRKKKKKKSTEIDKKNKYKSFSIIIFNHFKRQLSKAKIMAVWCGAIGVKVRQH